MGQRHRGTRRSSLRGSVGVGFVLALAGLLFVSSARLAGHDGRQPQDLPHLVEAEIRRADAVAAQVEALREEIERLTLANTVETADGADGEVELLAVVAGHVPVTGPGLTVELSDASLSAPRPDGVTNDDLVVHQQDLQAVVNALWAGGAEAMTLQGERVTSTSAFRCVGNVLLLHGKVYSPPYVVQAIGDPEALSASLDASPGVQAYLDAVDLIGLGWQVSSDDHLELPAYEGTQELQHAAVPLATAEHVTGPTP